MSFGPSKFGVQPSAQPQVGFGLSAKVPAVGPSKAAAVSSPSPAPIVKAPASNTSASERDQRSDLLVSKQRKGKWSREEAQQAQAHNMAQLETLSQLVMLSRACSDVTEWKATLDLEAECLDHFAPIVANINRVIGESEALVAKLQKENAVLNPTSGAAVGEDARLSQAWRAKEKDFVDMFLRHRDRFLSLQQGEALRCLSELELEGILKLSTEEEHHAFAQTGVAREYLRPDI